MRDDAPLLVRLAQAAMLFWGLAGAVTATAALPAAGVGLAFEVEERIVEVGFYPRQMWVGFPFTVEAPHAVKILSFSSTCPCTAVALDRTVYYPGQKGSVSAVYDYRGETQPDVQLVRVSTDQADKPKILRVVPLRMAEAIWIERPRLEWLPGRLTQPQTLEVEVAPDLSDVPLVVSVDGAGWDASLAPGQQPGIHTLTVRAANTGVQPATLTLTISPPSGTAGPALPVQASLRLVPPPASDS